VFFVIVKQVDGGHMAVTGSKDCTVRVWDVSAGAEEYVLRGHTDAVLCVHINAHHIVSSAEDDTLQIWARASCVNRLKVW
jgi:WD40 repeat protein